MSWNQWILLFLFFAALLFSQSVYSLQLALYPELAESRNATALEYTIVLGCYSGAMAIVSPFVGHLLNLPHVTPKGLYCASILLTGGTTIVFGFVIYIKSRIWFIGISIILRLVEGFFASIVFVTSYVLIPQWFPERLTKFIMGGIETIPPFSYMIGPLIGTGLNLIGGFQLPFAVIGGLIIFVGGIIIITISETESSSTTTTAEEKESLIHSNIPANKNAEETEEFQIWKNSKICLGFLCIFLELVISIFPISTIEPYLRKEIGSTQIQSSIIIAIAYFWGIFIPIFGFWSSNKLILSTVVFVGTFVQLIGVLLIGPLPVPATYWITLGAITLMDFGGACIIFPTFLLILIESENLGLENNEKVKAQLSGFYLTALTSGAMIGPPISGALYDSFGFRNAEYFNVVLLGILLIYFGGNLIINWTEYYKKRPFEFCLF